MKSGDKLTEEEAKKIRVWLLKDGYGYSAKAENKQAALTNFSETYHCETLLMSLYLLGKKREQIVDDLPDMEAVHLRLPSKTITDALLGAMEVLPVSKRCCPACHALVEWFKENCRSGLLYPGKHAVWSAAALPPWIPREAGIEVLKAARKALQERFKAILSKKGSSSPGIDAHFKSDDTSPEFSRVVEQDSPPGSDIGEFLSTSPAREVEEYELSTAAAMPSSAPVSSSPAGNKAKKQGKMTVLPFGASASTAMPPPSTVPGTIAQSGEPSEENTRGAKRSARNFSGAQADAKKPKGEGNSDDEELEDDDVEMAVQE